MPAEPIAEPAAVSRIEAMLREIQAELVCLRKQVADGRSREWLSINACARRFGVSRAIVLRAIAAGKLSTRLRTSSGGFETHAIHVDSARTEFSAVPV